MYSEKNQHRIKTICYQHSLMLNEAVKEEQKKTSDTPESHIKMADVNLTTLVITLNVNRKADWIF